MSKTKSPAPLYKFIYVVKADGAYVGSPTDVRTKNHELAATWTEESEALAVARALHGVVATRQIVDQMATAMRDKGMAANSNGKSSSLMAALAAVPTVAPMARRRTKEQEPATKGAKAEPPKAPKGPSRTEVMALLATTGLPVQEKSSTHVGNPKGTRLVIPKAAVVTRIYGYQMEDASLPGYVAPDERKARRLGKVSVVADISAADQMLPFIAALCRANGVKVPKLPKAPAKRSKAKTPPTLSPEPLSESPSGQVVEPPKSETDTSQTIQGDEEVGQ